MGRELLWSICLDPKCQLARAHGKCTCEKEGEFPKLKEGRGCENNKYVCELFPEADDQFTHYTYGDLIDVLREQLLNMGKVDILCHAVRERQYGNIWEVIERLGRILNEMEELEAKCVWLSYI